MMSAKNLRKLVFRLRGGLSRDLYGMQHEKLYTESRAGTKHVIEKYNDTVVQALDLISNTQEAEDQVDCDS